MRAIVYSDYGGSEVLRLIERPLPEPGPGEVRVRVAYSGVNPTDWKARRGRGEGRPPFAEIVPDQDGAGVVDAVGAGVAPSRLGERVWLWEAQWGRAEGTAQEYVALSEAHAAPLPGGLSFELGACLGIPALTAHRCLTVAPAGPRRLGRGALAGAHVLVAGGAGAVGHAAIQLARFAGAEVMTTVSGPDKAALALSAGAHVVVNYREPGALERLRAEAPDGVDVIVEVAPAANAELDRALLAAGGTVAVYASEGGELPLDVRELMSRNAGYRFVLVYTVPAEAKAEAVADVTAAALAGALEAGEHAGLPLHRYPLEQAAAAHDAVEGGVVGKVLLEVDASLEGAGEGPRPPELVSSRS